MQFLLNHIITEKATGTAPDFQYGMFPMPYAAHIQDDFFLIVAMMLPFIMIIAFIYPYFTITGHVVSEKADKIKEGLQMMGASVTTYWCSIYIYYALKFTVISLLCTVVAWKVKVFEYSSFAIIFLWFTLFLGTLLTSAIMFSTLFDNPKTASTVSTVLLLALYFTYAFGSMMKESGTKTALCLNGPACFAMSISNFAKYEEGQIGLNWDTLSEEYEDLSFGTVLGMMALDCILYIIMAMYLDRVIPSRYGQKLPFYFPLQKSFWCPNAAYDSKRNKELSNRPLPDSDKYEQLDNDKMPSIRIRNLHKSFSAGFGKEPFVAVDGISLDLYRDEIFCLLGHNGAGKTTTISMLSGMLNVTSGFAAINGKNVVNEMKAIRQSLGVCPQHNVLWPTLTVREHLVLFANLKGVPSAEIDEEVDAMIAAVKMREKRDRRPTELSGGQKRKLSLGIALIGDSNIVFLDEPTSLSFESLSLWIQRLHSLF